MYQVRYTFRILPEIAFRFLRFFHSKNKYAKSMEMAMNHYIKSSYIDKHHFSFVQDFLSLSSVPSAILKKSLCSTNFGITLPYYNQLRRYAKKAIIKESKGKGHKPKVLLTDEEMMDIIDLNAYHSELQFVIDDLKDSYVNHLSIRTSAGNIENIPVKIDNDEYPLNELAQISRKNPHLIVLNLSSFPEGLKPVIQAIHDSGVGLNPQQEGTTIYLPVPKVTREHRETLVKNAKALCVKAKDDIRDIQNKFIKEARKQTEMSKDLLFNSQEQIKYLAEKSATEVEKIMKMKQQEILRD